jgi:1,3,6,8-tetrahydroxynaphthalene synthase
MSIVCQPALALPKHCVTQRDLLDALRTRYRDLPHLERMLRLVEHTTVEQRYFAAPLSRLFDHEGIERRGARYLAVGIPLALSAIKHALAHAALQADDIAHVILTSCTAPALLLPGLDAYLVNAGAFPCTVRRLPIAQMGCHAGAMALALAHHYLLGHPDENVLICAVELSSLNEQPADTDASTFVSRGLFGDGAAAMVVRGDDRGPGLRLFGSAQYLVPNTTSDMRYELDHLGNHFRTRREVVPGLKKGFPAIHIFLERYGYRASDLDFLVSHTGGPRVMDAVVEALGVPERLIAASRESLREVGNLSSVSVLDVLRRTFERFRPHEGDLGLMLGFGPGSTIEMLLAEWRETP